MVCVEVGIMYLGDPCMFAVSSDQREHVWAWARDANIQIEYNGTDFNQDVWRVVNPKDSAWFTLRWS